MKSTKKVVVLALCMAAIAAASVFGTMAYFTSEDTATNTFTVGNVTISLDEAKVDENGKEVTPETRVKENTYKLIPGQSYDKDPTVHVNADSEDCWLFVKVVNDIFDIEIHPETDTEKKIATQMSENGWNVVDGTNNIYAYEKAVSAGAGVPVFDNFTIDGDSVTGNKLKLYEDKTVTVTAYAIQKAGFDTAADAWQSASSAFNING